MKHFLICFFICGFNIFDSKAQQALSDSELVEKYRLKADIFTDINQYDSAIYYFQKTMDVCLNASTSPDDKWMKYWYKKKMNVAQMQVRKGNPTIGNITITEILADVKRYFEYDDIYAKALKVKGIVLMDLGKYDSTIYYYKKSLAISNQISTKPLRPVAFTLNNLGHVYSVIGEYELSKQYQLQALEIRKKLFGNEPHLDFTNSYLNLGNVYYFSGDLNKALEYWKEVVNMTRRLGNKDARSASMALGNLGEVYKEIGDLENALTYNKKALKLKLEIYGEYHTRTANSYSTLASTLVVLNRREEAEKYYEKAIHTKTKIYGSKHPEIAEILNVYGNLMESNGDIKRALSFYQKAIIANVPGFEDSINVYTAPINTQCFNTLFLLESLESKINIFQKSSNKDELEYALNHINVANRIIQDIRKNTTTSADNIQLAGRFNKIYEQGIEISLIIYNRNPTNKNADMVYQYFEKNKSVALNFSIKENIARKYTDISGDEIAEIDSVNTLIESIKSVALSNPLSDSLKNVLFENNRLYETLILQIEKKYPQYYASKYNFDVPTISDVRNHFNNSNTALVEYFVGTDNVYAIVIGNEFVNFFSFKYRGDLKEKIIDFRSSIMNQSEEYVGLANQLYQKNFEPIDSILRLNQISEIVIINDGILSLLPFELLIYEDQFLCTKYNIGYANSATIMLDYKPINDANDNLISYAPVFNSPDYLADAVRGGLANIPGSIEEAKTVVEIFDGLAILDIKATESSFRFSAENYGIIHLATHAIIEDENPDNSRLVFSLTDTTEQDGYLHAYEIYNLKLNAQLITLSACNTGFGKINKGEGVMSLSRAFAYAGVPATVVSLWPASDKSTPELMKYFYQNLKDGQTKDIALNNARKEYLETATGKARHPFYWGGFVLIGDNSPIVQKSNWMMWMMIFGLAIVLVFGVVWRRRVRCGEM